MCVKCGAVKVDEQIGTEEVPDCLGWATGSPCGECYTCHLVQVFRKVRRVLRDDGVLFLNLGDSYTSGGRDGHGTRVGYKQQTNRGMNGKADPQRPPQPDGLKSKDLIGVPWRVALALQADGWYLRSDMPWIKRNPMPNSADDRPGAAHEYFFQLTKSPDYYFDMEAVRKAAVTNVIAPHWTEKEYDQSMLGQKQANGVKGRPRGVAGYAVEGQRNFRTSDLWFESLKSPHGLVGCGDDLLALDVTVKSFKGAHFATFPVDLIAPLVKAGTSWRGCCPDCGAPWPRVVEKERRATRPGVNTKVTSRAGQGGVRGTSGEYGADGRAQFRAAKAEGNRDPERHVTDTKTVGWMPGCACYGVELIPKPPDDEAPEKEWRRWRARRDELLQTYETLTTVPCRVLDPFCGAGTTGLVCGKLNRHFVGIELSPDFLQMALQRLQTRGRVDVTPKNKKRGLGV